MKSHYRKLYRFMAVVTVLTSAIVTYPQSSDATSQANESLRVVNTERWNIKDPVKIEKILVNGESITPGVAFKAGPDWLDHLTVVLRNDSGKILVSARVVVDFPDTGNGDSQHPRFMHQEAIGKIPESGLYTANGEKMAMSEGLDQLNVAPGGAGNVSFGTEKSNDLTAQKSETLAAHLTERGYNSDQSRCTIRLGSMYFRDGTKWTIGNSNFFKPDPTSRGKYIHIKPDEFYGRRMQ